MKIPFEIIIDNLPFADVCPQVKLVPIDNKKVFGIANDFEDGKWRIKRFLNFIWDNAKETALSKKERDALINQESSTLERAAQNLRITNKDKLGGEIAEILLYAIMRQYYGALPVVPKIYYKQNRNDYAKGADSVHIVIESEKHFSIWLGEAKFYNDISDTRLDVVVESVHETLCTNKVKKENSIITNVADLNDFSEINNEMKESIKDFLSEDTTIDKIKPILHIPIMLLYECNITKDETTFNNAYREKIKKYQINRAHSYFLKQIEKCSDIMQYSEIKFHLILCPVPQKEEIVKRFIKRAKELRDE